MKLGNNLYSYFARAACVVHDKYIKYTEIEGNICQAEAWEC